MMRSTFLLMLATLSCAGPPGDPRVATVAVDERDAFAVHDAINYWNDMGANIDWVVSTRCEYDLSRQCIRVYEGRSVLNEIGRCIPTRVGSDIMVVRDLTYPARLETLRHEIGHALGLGHTVNDKSDVMDPMEGFASCIGPQTRDSWKRMYGDDLNLGCSAP